jgi:hypothetical protein
MFKNNNRIINKSSSTEKWLNYLESIILNCKNDILALRDFNYKENLLSNFEFKINLNQKINFGIFFKRKNVEFLVEKWNFNITLNDDSKMKFINLNKMNKKVLMIKKTILVLLRILPLYQLFKFKQKNIDYSLEIELEKKENDFKIDENKFEKILIVLIDDEIGKLELLVNYISKNLIFETENEILKAIMNEEVSARIEFLTNELSNDINKESEEENLNNEEKEINYCEKEKKEIENLENEVYCLDNNINNDSKSEIFVDEEFIEVTDKDNNIDCKQFYERGSLFNIGNYEENQNLNNIQNNNIYLSGYESKQEEFNYYDTLHKFLLLKENSNTINLNTIYLNKLNKN